MLAALGATQAARAEYPEKPIRLIVNAAPGGAADSTSRLLATALAQRLGQPVVIENKPGASGAIGLDAVAKAAPDGYTIGHANLATFVVAALAAKHLPYKPTQDFTPIARHWAQPNLLGVNPKLPVRTVADLVAYSKAQPNALSYGSTGNGTSLHVVTELFRSSAGIQMTHVPYKSAPAAESDLAAGFIQVMVSNFTSMEPQVKAGRIRALAITGPKRSPLLPDVPTIREAGFPEVEMETWGGIVGPANLPEAIVKKLNAEINAVLSDPKIVKQHEALGATVTPGTPAQFGEQIKADNAKWGAVIRTNNISLD
ncbi:MAG TPA: tripartite tricarboxylate transporter substrate binding protein [Ramlibacter sp.]|uniref:Bug family tripartite tricarboxylate transporter substrate binding protein n=1 Tax=Ramlibacter sp. TaxID=1917967 RepID=UPI002D7F9690|nr:tripartite tricarboxylate transporter substrate binding protein [Ramlibacter sp.]HET8746603.1 tripartite tricarboxylate transporter substrate binding protein [Ramlibacter sp.]